MFSTGGFVFVRISEMKIGDFFEEQDWDKPMGVWQYPLAQVKRDPVEGYYIDYLTFPGLLVIDKMQVGDNIAGDTLNLTPLWTVTHIDDQQSRVFVTPTDANPFSSGVGAGGAVLQDFDYDVLSGQAEKDIIDRVLVRIQTGNYVDYDDVAYILKGTVPYRFGANGAEGGWYSCTSWHARGAMKENLGPVEIMKQDARTLQKLGFDVPPKALTGELKPESWSSLISGSKETDPDLKLAGEDWNDPYTCIKFALTQRQPQIVSRNVIALIELVKPFPRKMFDDYYKMMPRLAEATDDFSKAKRRLIDDQIEELREAWRAGELAEPKMLALMYDFSIRFFNKTYPKQAKLPDPYWYSKEQVIQFASAMGWLDILRLYSTTIDATNRRYVAAAFRENDSLDDVLRMYSVETDPETMDTILSCIEKLDFEVLKDIIRRDYAELIQLAEATYYHGSSYHGEQLKKYVERIKKYYLKS